MTVDRWCPGSGDLVPIDHVDGNWIVTCPICRHYRQSDPDRDSGKWAVVAPHRLTSRNPTILARAERATQHQETGR
jgi:hypothetical protein